MEPTESTCGEPIARRVPKHGFDSPTGFATPCNPSSPWHRLPARGLRLRGFGTPGGSAGLTSSSGSELELHFEGAAMSRKRGRLRTSLLGWHTRNSPLGLSIYGGGRHEVLVDSDSPPRGLRHRDPLPRVIPHPSGRRRALFESWRASFLALGPQHGARAREVLKKRTRQPLKSSEPCSASNGVRPCGLSPNVLALSCRTSSVPAARASHRAPRGVSDGGSRVAKRASRRFGSAAPALGPSKSSGWRRSRSRQDCVEIAIAVVSPHWTDGVGRNVGWPIGG
jgi:hypothetical protein